MRLFAALDNHAAKGPLQKSNGKQNLPNCLPLRTALPSEIADVRQSTLFMRFHQGTETRKMQSSGKAIRAWGLRAVTAAKRKKEGEKKKKASMLRQIRNRRVSSRRLTLEIPKSEKCRCPSGRTVKEGLGGPGPGQDSKQPELKVSVSKAELTTFPPSVPWFGCRSRGGYHTERKKTELFKCAD